MLLRIVSKREHFNRSGLSFSREPVIVDTDKEKLTDVQIQALRNEQFLDVTDADEKDVATTKPIEEAQVEPIPEKPGDSAKEFIPLSQRRKKK